MRSFTRTLCLILVVMVAGCAPPPKPQYIAVPESSAPLDANPNDIAIVNRITWGGNTSAAQLVRSEGLARYLDGQLHPSENDGLPEQARIQIAAMEISQHSPVELNQEIRALQQVAQKAKGTPDYDAAQKAYQQKMTDLAREAATRSLLRDLYSKNQLKEQLVWFWMNHFNVSQNKAENRAFMGDYEETAIRPHVLGKFQDLLIATAFHPVMLQYLDNTQNAVGHINENYAREIMELHSMGVGSGYTQKDVQELARILTGLGTNFSGKPPNASGKRADEFRVGGLYEYNPYRHDYGDKIFLGYRIRGEGLKEVAEAIALINANPATAHFISKKLAEYFCCDTPSDSLVGAMTTTFRTTDGDIRAILKTMFAAPEFKASLGHKFKDPIHYAVSALRVAYGDTVIINSQPLFNWLNRMSEPLYGHETPDGYPLTEAAWSGPGDMATRFEIARLIGYGHSGLYKFSDDKTKEPAPPPDIRKSRYYQAMAPHLGATTMAALAEAKTPTQWNMLFLASPEFMHR